MIRSRAALFGAVILSAVLLRADAPLTIHYQGKLADVDGNPRPAASFDMVFEVYGQPLGGAPLFADTRTGAARVPVFNGVFDVRIGEGALSGAPLAQVLAANDNLWLQVTVAGTPLLPRRKLASAAYALAVRAGSVGPSQLAPLGVSSLDLAPGAADTAQLADGAVTDVHVSSVAWSKVTGLPAGAGSPALKLNSAVVEPIASTITFSSATFAVGAAGQQANVALASTVTVKGNAFNAAGQLLLLNGSGAVPSAQVAGAYPNITGVGTITQGVWNAMPVGIAFGGTGASSAAAARTALGAAGSASSFSAGVGLTGGGTFAGDRTIGINDAAVSGGCNGAAQKLVWSSSTVRLECAADRDVNTIAMTGDVTAATQTASTVTALQGLAVSSATPSTGQALKWNQANNRWEPTAESTGGLSGSGTPPALVRWTGASTMGAAPSISTATGSGLTITGNLSASGNIIGFPVTSGTDPGHTHTGFAPLTHTHSTNDITSGVLPQARGGTGVSSFVAGGYARVGSATAWEFRTPAQVRVDLDVAVATHTHTMVLPAGFDNYLARFTGNSGYDVSRIYQTDSGRLGVGTTSPLAPLHVKAESYGTFGSVAGDQYQDSLRITGGQTGLEILCQANCAQDYALQFDEIGTSTLPITRRGIWATASGGGTPYGMRVYSHIDPLTSASQHAVGLKALANSSGNASIIHAAYGRAYGNVGVKYGLYSEATGGAFSNYGVHVLANGSNSWSAYFQGNVFVNGSLSKASGTFDIEHPDPAKAAQGWHLRHSFVESPTRGDNLYHWTVQVTGGKAEIALPSYFKFLNEDVQVWVAPVDHFGRGAGDVDAALGKVEIIADKDGAYNVLVMGTRKDEGAKKIFDDKGIEYRRSPSEPSSRR